MNNAKTLAFHSYKGGTGKTTLVTNLAATFASIGMRVCLLDFDLYAPSFTMYFRKKPELYLNDLLSGDADISDILVNVSSEFRLKGELFLGFSNPKKEDIQRIELQPSKQQLIALRNFIAAKKELFSKYKIDYLILDTSPGIRYWSINAIAVADFMFLMMKASEMDITGTKTMITEIYESLIKFGSKYFVILNKVPGASPLKEYQHDTNDRMILEIEERIGTQVVGTIPCFCEVQFNRHEFLSTIKIPKHPFSEKIFDIADKINQIK